MQELQRKCQYILSPLDQPALQPSPLYPHISTQSNLCELRYLPNYLHPILRKHLEKHVLIFYVMDLKHGVWF